MALTELLHAMLQPKRDLNPLRLDAERNITGGIILNGLPVDLFRHQPVSIKSIGYFLALVTSISTHYLHLS